MGQSVEHILGQVEQDLVVPGTRPGSAEQVRYVSYDRGSQRPVDLFEQVVLVAGGAIAKEGGVVLDPVVATAPDATSFYALSYHGDISGWRQQIEDGAKALGFLTARVQGGTLILSDGRSYDLSVCHFEKDANGTA